MGRQLWSTHVSSCPTQLCIQLTKARIAHRSGMYSSKAWRVLLSFVQKGNPLLTHVRNVGWEYGDIVPDYQVGATTGVLYLRYALYLSVFKQNLTVRSIRYHRLHPEYVHTRIQKLGTAYHLRVLLVMCDVDDHQATIRELTKVSPFLLPHPWY